MNNDSLLRALAERNPVREEPPYDQAAESGLHDLLATFRTGPDAGARGRRARRRTLPAKVPAWGMAAAGVGLAAAMVAGVLVYNHGTNDATRQSTASPQVNEFPAVNGATPVSLVVYRTKVALSAASKYILQGTETAHESTGFTDRSVIWLDEGDPRNFRVEALGADGNLQFDVFWFHHNGKVVSYSIDYVTRQYTVADPLKLRRKPGLALNRSGNDATLIAQDLKKGTDRVLGTTTINGRTVLRLSNDEPGMNREIWMDSTTYLPVRMTAHGSFGSYTIDYSWIPRTSQNISKILEPRVPSGFAKVSQLPGG
jgi:outer membrane lipoprotein-sorting protein